MRWVKLALLIPLLAVETVVALIGLVLVVIGNALGILNDEID